MGIFAPCGPKNGGGKVGREIAGAACSFVRVPLCMVIPQGSAFGEGTAALEPEVSPYRAS